MRIKVTINSLEDLKELQELIAAITSKEEKTPAPAPAPKKTTAKKTAPAPEPETPAEEPARTAEEIINAAEAKEEANETDVKVMLADKIKGGKKAEVKALFDEYGVSKLSELIAKYPDKLAEFADKARAL